jgi:hypothetical protein
MSDSSVQLVVNGQIDECENCPESNDVEEGTSCPTVGLLSWGARIGDTGGFQVATRVF